MGTDTDGVAPRDQRTHPDIRLDQPVLPADHHAADAEADDVADAPPKTGETLLTVIIAFAANVLIAVAKSVAAVITGSASMVAEAAHSWADAGNEVLLLIAERRSQRPADSRHPLGYGKDAYIWSMFAAFGLFTAGAVLSIQHGIQSLLEPEPATDYVIAYVVLGVSFVLEGISFIRALREARAAAHELNRGTLDHVIASSNPTLRAVFAEDAAALIGLAIAFLGILLHQLTGSSAFDAIGSIAVGVLLGVVAVLLIARNRAFLLGEAIGEADRQAVLLRLLARHDVDRVTSLHVEFIGPGQLFLIAAVDLAGNVAEDALAVELRRIERELERDPHLARVVLTVSAADEASLEVPATRRSTP
ncbi:cation diffusion facilitator family transporter [Leifsonia sp. Leaf264]|uniref:cation diffusion facilitator family transporter n=1 Tax=Leifsonia sp. Leaf264 TaxID=1736314 RepID=UPI0009EB1D7E|nr:cation diffusion facilitator family transporter [Leifsonia sp. Leaf264]